MRRGARIAAAGALALTVFAQAAQAGYPELFGTLETRSNNISMFPKWRGALSRYFNERRLPEASCTSSLFNRCHLRAWKSFLETMKGEDLMIQVRAVNAFMNRQPYLSDPRNYGVPDYWASPYQFLTRDGDCEDYAIAKFMSLRALGVPNDMMRIVVLQDLNLHVGHAILVVYVDGEAWVLDNQIRGIVPADAIHHYRPIYSINETSWWLHRQG